MIKKKKNSFSAVQSLSNNAKMVRGTAWLSAGLMISRLIGALYIILWSRWIGEHYNLANALYALSYAPYALLIDIASAGFPMAITKQVSQLNARGEYKASVQLFKYSLSIMIVLGLLSGGALYLFSNAFIANAAIPTGDVADNIYVLRTLIPALIIIPSLSLIRGFFQGFQQMTTPAVSQIIEQIVRVGYMLTMTYYIMKIQNGSYIDAVAQSTLAAFIGALVSLCFVLFELYKEWPYISEQIALGSKKVTISFKTSIQTVLKDSIPFVLMSAGTGLLGMIDINTYRPLLNRFSTMSELMIATTYAWFSSNVQKLLSLVSALTTAVQTTTVANIASLQQQKKTDELGKLVSKNLVFFSLILLPAAIGLFLIASPIYRVFYTDANGVSVLRVHSLYLIAMSFFSFFVSVFQGMGKHSVAIKALSILLLAKLTGNILFIPIIHEQGPGVASLVAAIIANYYLWSIIDYRIQLDVPYITHKLVQIIQSMIGMSAVVLAIYTPLMLLLPEFGVLSNLIKTFVPAVLGAIAYIYLLVWQQVTSDILPAQTEKLRKLFKLDK